MNKNLTKKKKKSEKQIKNGRKKYDFAKFDNICVSLIIL